MRFSYHWLKELTNVETDPAKLAELISLHAFEVKSLDRVGHDTIFDIDMLSNRAADAASHVGMAREIAAIAGVRFDLPPAKLAESPSLSISDWPVPRVEDAALCPRYSVRAIRGVRVGESPAWLKDRLAALGLRAVNNVVDAANYVMLETGQPLHAFDARKVRGAIAVRRAKPGEQLATLDGQTLDLDPEALVIADGSGAIGLAGIKGGASTGVDERTTDLLIEAANFQAATIRRSSRRYGLVTDAAVRFSRGVDVSATVQALDRVAALIQELAGGEVAKGVYDAYPNPAQPAVVELAASRVRSLLGSALADGEIVELLARLGFTADTVQPGMWRVTAPTFRQDIAIEEDLIEEVGRLYGLERIQPELPQASIASSEGSSFRRWVRNVSEALVGFGFAEVYNYVYTASDELDWLGMRERAVELENPVNTARPFLAPSLVPRLVQNAADNFRFFSEVRIFETGKTFAWDDDRSGVNESTRLAGIIAYRNPAKPQRHQAALEAKGTVENILELLGIDSGWFDDAPKTAAPYLASGRFAEIKVGEQVVGLFGEVAPEVAERCGIADPIAVFELDAELLEQLTEREREYEPLPKYPALVRDISMFVPAGTRIVEVENVISTASGELVEDVDLFDLYEPEGSEERRSVAFHIVYRAKDRTLSEKEIDALHKKICKALETELGAEIR